MKRTQIPRSSLAVAVLAATAAASPLAAQVDIGLFFQNHLDSRSRQLFGILAPLAEPADDGDYVPREDATAGERLLLGNGLTAEFVARNVAQDGDMIALWPDDAAPTHLVVCIEQGRSGTTPLGNDGLNAAVQRVELASGAVATILHGMERCDGIRRTAWGTIIASEETDDGRVYEILAPLATTGHWVADRATGDIRTAIDGLDPSANVAQRAALPTIAWEGIAVLESGVVIGGDELRPGDDGLDLDGGAIFKFVPEVPHAGGPIGDLDDSPLVAGPVYALSISCREAASSDFPQYGQGCEVGVGAWVKVDAFEARADADANGATGYYRPEDLHPDPTFEGEGVRFCWTNTGREAASHLSEVVCAEDPTPLPEAATEILDDRTGFFYLGDGAEFALAVASRFIEGDARFNSFDNLDFQPTTGILYVIEDHDFGEIFACLPDREDRDVATDGCIALASVVDPEAEPTGFIFSGDGRTAYVVIQHGEQPAELLDFASNPVDGTTDDLLR
ncbi:MAG: DUF839 domain-containing protein, partial [Chloroflexi bacterium]|nr:DUF839 domain-containing protein [Chloroflexota bacterium]